MFEETNQMMEESEELENLPENLFDFDEEEMQDEGDPSALPQDDTKEESLHRHTAVPLPLGKGGLDEGIHPAAPLGKGGLEERKDGRESGTAQDAEGGNHAGQESSHRHAAVPPPLGKEGTVETAGSVLRVKYNGEEKDISLDEARTLAQKGLNYDHVVSERDRNRNAFDFLMERAKGEGITVEQLIERERGQAENQRLEAKMKEIRSRDDDASEETIKRLAQFELEAEKRNKDKERETAEAQALESKQNAEIDGWNRLFAEHPELKAKEGEKLSPEVTGLFELIGQGYTPVEAFYIKRSRELEVQNKMQADAKEAKQKSIGSLSGNQKAEAEDDFLAGFLGKW